MGHPGLLVDLVVALGVAVVGAAVAVRLGQSVILGYILAGVVLAPVIAGMPGRSTTVAQVADVGVVLLMFAIGVRTSLHDLRHVGLVALVGGTAQVLLLLGAGCLAGLALGWPPVQALFFGAVIAISSSAVLATILHERGEEGTEHGHLALAWSAVQDVSTIALVVVLSVVAGQHTSLLAELLEGAVRALAFLVMLVPLGLWVLPRLFAWMAALQVREVFVLAVAAVALGLAYAATFFGLSVALGAFVAGVVVGESDLSHQILGAILPLRDTFAALFFVSIGLLINPVFVAHNLGPVLLTLALIVLAKGLISAMLIALCRYPVRTALLSSVLLAQAGEFSFILAQLGTTLKAVTPAAFSVMLTSAGASLVLAPLLYRLVIPLARWASRQWADAALTTHPRFAGGAPLRGHAIVCGYGRVGQVIVAALERRQIPLVVVEHDQRLVRQLRAQGTVTLLGDAANPVLLEYMRLEEARVLVLAIPDALSVRQVVDHARRVNPTLAIVSRTHSMAEWQHLRRQGVEVAVMGELELALGMTRYTLQRFGVSDADPVSLGRSCPEAMDAPVR